MLTDFGSASVVWNSEDISREMVRWCAPEVLGGDVVSGTRPTYASDVFSFGMVVLEVSFNRHEWGVIMTFRFFLDLFGKTTVRRSLGWRGGQASTVWWTAG